MKAYILYIITLLAALALPANGQTGSIDTKYAPNDPAMPYKLSLVTIGNNNGTVAVEDDNNSGGVIFVGKDTLVYGSSSDMTTTTVKLTVTPNTGCVVREGYPKAYKTGDTETIVEINNEASPYTFEMPNKPVTVEMAYAHKIKSINPITLKETATADNVVSKLPGYVYITLGSGRKDSLAVNNWKFVGKGTETSTDPYDATEGAANRFTATLTAALPDSIVDATVPLFPNNTCTVVVANMAKPLQPAEADKKITISSGNGDNLTGQVEGGSEAAFNGTIGDGKGTTTVKELEVSSDVKDATLTLNSVTVVDNSGGGSTTGTTIKGGADLTLKIEGENNLGTLKVETGATVVLDKAEGASLGTTAIENAGTFIDSTATVTQVKGAGALNIKADVDGGGSVTQNTSITLTASTNDKAGTTSFIWQKKNADGSYTEIKTNKYDNMGAPATRADAGITDTYLPATTSVGSTDYRCLVKREVTTSGSSGTPPVVTLLSTKSETVNVTPKSDPNPDPDPTPTVYHTVTLPTLVGATTDPAAGAHKVEAWGKLVFAILLDKGYDQSKPVVTTSRGETLTPRASDGKYEVTFVREDITLIITGIMNNIPTGNATISADGTRLWSNSGMLFIHTESSKDVHIYNFNGNLQKAEFDLKGDMIQPLPTGNYIVVIGGRSYKVQVSR